jgi:DNA polymerase/3'-5' exonuclease PolX
MSTNEQIIRVFEQLRDLRLQQGQGHRANAYIKAIAGIRKYPKQIQSGAEARAIPGIGESLASKIDEIIRTGTVAELGPSRPQEDVERERVLNLFMTVSGAGPATAAKWYEAGYRTLEEIPASAATREQRISLQYQNEFNQRIPREEIAEAETILHRCLDPLGIQFEIAGSYRRGRSDSGDIDILVIEKPGIDVIGTMTQCSIFVRDLTLAYGTKKFRGVGKIRQTHRRIDIEVVQPHEYPFAITYFTGPQSFNIKMRAHASQYGLTLNEKGLFGPMGESYPATSEQNLFEILGLQYLTPEERDKY